MAWRGSPTAGRTRLSATTLPDGKIDVWKLPADTGYANLNTGAFDGKGTHWFTGQNGIYGRVNAATGKVEVWKDPKARGPYGIATAPDGTVWYVSLAGSHLASIDSASGQISVIEPPTAGAGLRRVWADSKGDLWITGWNSGELYRYRPSNRSWKTWKLPGDAPKAYAVYVDERDHVWVSDFGDNSTRVFDPRTETFVARYPGQRGGGKRPPDTRPQGRGFPAGIGHGADDGRADTANEVCCFRPRHRCNDGSQLRCMGNPI